ncbi:MAG: hydrogenase small subunit [Actinomycetota bacterium]
MAESVIKGLSRREFIKLCGATAALMGVSQSYIPQIAAALEEAAAKPPVIWIQSQACTGCVISAINSNRPSAADIVLDILSFRFQPNISAAAGDVAIKAIEDTIENEKGKYVLVWEGAIPDKQDGLFSSFGEKDGKPITSAEWLPKAADNAAAVIAMGACSCWGGIPRANAEVTGAKGLLFNGTKKGGAYTGSTPVINVAGCPPNPDWLIGTIVYYLTFKKVPPLDEFNRPKMFYGQTIHDNCYRRTAFEAGLFLEKWGDPDAITPTEGGNATMDYCLLNKGCKGPVTYADCPIRRWNSRTSWPIGAHGICIGCTQPEFYQELAPLYEKVPTVSVVGIETTADTIGKVLGVATAIGIGAHLIGNIATGRVGGKKGGE